MHRVDFYKKRPFKTRNADSFRLGDALSLFVPPSSKTQLSLRNPFDIDNVIIRGARGSGKTMFLRANHAYYLHSLVPSLTKGTQVTLPVFIKLNDFQHIADPKTIYKKLIVKIVEEICNIYQELSKASQLAKLHDSVRWIRDDYFRDNDLKTELLALKKLTSDAYKEQISRELRAEGGVVNEFVKLSAELKFGTLLEIEQKQEPSISDVERCYRRLLGNSDAQIVLLLDEAGSVPKEFFTGNGGESMFEVFMNQCRTSTFITTKIAIYPNSFQDVLRETRYGDIINLEDFIFEKDGYNDFRYRTENLIWTYLNHDVEESQRVDIFEIFEGTLKDDFGDAIEQAINGSRGNMRRLIQILDGSMIGAYERHGGAGQTSADDVTQSLKKNSQTMLGMYDSSEREFLREIGTACRSRSTFRFKFPNNSVTLTKYVKKSAEHNIINLVQANRGKSGYVYEFDYAYCVANEIPTHCVRNTERIDRLRSLTEADWIQRVTTLSADIIAHAAIPTKAEGSILYRKDTWGLIKGSDGKEYIFLFSDIVDGCEVSDFHQGRRVRFVPLVWDGKELAGAVESL